MDRSQLRMVLGDELFALANRLPAAIIGLEPLRGRGPCSSFHLTLADGQEWKAKCLLSAADAERVDRLLGLLAHAAFPAVRLRCGAALATGWVHGQPLQAAERDANVLRACGALHAVLHAPHSSSAARGQWRSSEHRRSWLQPDLDLLVRAGWIERQEAAALLAVVDRHAPHEWTVGLVHGDFNPENLVRTEAGEVVAVDNATLSIGPQPYDLARTWYRWPMSATQRAAYTAGYGAGGAAEELERHFPFWALTVLTRGAAFRVRAGRAGIAEPVARLRDGLETWR